MVVKRQSYSADLAQSVEHFTRNEGVVGSIPIVGIKIKKLALGASFFILMLRFDFANFISNHVSGVETFTKFEYFLTMFHRA